MADSTLAISDSLARAVQLARHPAEQLPDPSISNKRGASPATVAQEQLWFFDQLLPGNPAYNMPFPIRCREGMNNFISVEQSITEIRRRHEAFRMTLCATNAGPLQIVHPPYATALDIVDLSCLTETDREMISTSLATDEAQRPFHLERGPLFRTAAVLLDAEQIVLLRTIHHAVCDGWSIGLLNSELDHLTRAFAAGKQSELPEPAMQLPKFALRERESLRSPAVQAQLQHWVQKLTGAPTLELPTDLPRPAVQSFEGEKYPFSLSAELSARVRAVCRAERTTPFMLLLAIYKLLLSQYAGDEEVVVGTPLANRSRREYQDLIGPLFNMLAMRTSLAGDPPFREFLKRVRETATQAYAHCDVPFQKVAEAVQPQREMSRSPLFQVTFALNSAHSSPRALEPLEFTLRTARYDLELHLSDRADGIAGYWVYKTSLFEPSRIERLAGQFQHLVDRITLEPGARLSDLPALTAGEQHDVIERWNATEHAYLASKCCHELIEENARLNPDAIAIICGNESLSYGALDREADRLAHHLRGLGIRTEDVVAVFVDRSPQLIVSLLAILKAGAAYLPLDATYPKERIAYMLEDSGASLVLTEERFLPTLPERHGKTVALDGRWRETSTTSYPKVQRALVQNLAYVIYTSGSTGKPKAVQVAHRTLLNLVHWHISQFGVRNQDRATQFSGTAFDAMAWEVWPHLAAGASLHIVPDETRTSPDQLRNCLVNEGITITFIPTPLVDPLLTLKWPHDGSLRYLLTGGDTLQCH